MPDVTVTLTEAERDALVELAVSVMDILPDDTRRAIEAAAVAKLRAAAPAAPGPLERLEVWVRSAPNGHWRTWDATGLQHECTIHLWEHGVYRRPAGNWRLTQATTPTLAAAVDAVLTQVEAGE